MKSDSTVGINRRISSLVGRQKTQPHVPIQAELEVEERDRQSKKTCDSDSAAGGPEGMTLSSKKGGLVYVVQ